MSRILALAIAALAVANPAHAALSGYWTSAKVLHAVLGNGALADALRQQPVVSIVEIDGGYRVESSHCVVDVAVEYRQAGQPGPTPFEIRVGRATCR